jgi:hypothetical protein
MTISCASEEQVYSSCPHVGLCCDVANAGLQKQGRVGAEHCISKQGRVGAEDCISVFAWMSAAVA